MVDRTLDDADGRSAAAAPKAGPDPHRPPAWTDRVPDLLASYLAAVATFCAVTALLPVLREPLAWLRTAIEIVSVGAPPSLATAAFLGILAAAVRRRMRAAWWFVVLYLVLGRILGWITVLIDTDAAGPGGRLRRVGRPRLAAGGVRGGGARAVAVGPQALHGAHPARQRLARPRALPRRRRPRRPPRLGPAGAVPGHVAHHGGPRRLGVHVRARRARRPRRHRRRRRGAVRRHVRPRAVRRARRARRRLRAVPARAATNAASTPTTSSGCASLLAALRRRPTRSATSPPAATRRRSSPPTGKAAVTYRVVGGVSLASGDPIGDPEAWPRAIDAWLAEARALRLDPGRDGRERGGRPRLRAGRARRAASSATRRSSTSGEFALDGRDDAAGPPGGATGSSGPATPCRIRRHARAVAPTEMTRGRRRGPTPGATPTTERGFSMALGRLGDPADGAVRAGRGAATAQGTLRALLSLRARGAATGCRWT